MERRLGRVALRCNARTHAFLDDDRYIRIRCHDKRCADVQAAIRRGKGEKVIHVFDRERRLEWTELELPAGAGTSTTE